MPDTPCANLFIRRPLDASLVDMGRFVDRGEPEFLAEPFAAEIDELPLRDDPKTLEWREGRIGLGRVHVELTIVRDECVRERGPGVRADPALPSLENTPPLLLLLRSL